MPVRNAMMGVAFSTAIVSPWTSLPPLIISNYPLIKAMLAVNTIMDFAFTPGLAFR
jgi:hypothetical protein